MTVEIIKQMLDVLESDIDRHEKRSRMLELRRDYHLSLIGNEHPQAAELAMILAELELLRKPDSLEGAAQYMEQVRQLSDRWHCFYKAE